MNVLHENMLARGVLRHRITSPYLHVVHKHILYCGADACPVCMELLETSLVRLSPCGHVLHSDCHVRLAAHGHSHCPICRGRIECEGSSVREGGSSSSVTARRISAQARRLLEDELDSSFRIEVIHRMHYQGLIECLGSTEKVWRFACLICGRAYDVADRDNGPILRNQNLNPAAAFADSQHVLGGTPGLLAHFPEVAICCGMWSYSPYKVAAQAFVQMRLVQEAAAPDTPCFRGRHYREMREAYEVFQRMTFT